MQAEGRKGESVESLIPFYGPAPLFLLASLFLLVDSGEYEVADEAAEASDQLWARLPEAQILIERVGHRAAFHAYRSVS